MGATQIESRGHVGGLGRPAAWTAAVAATAYLGLLLLPLLDSRHDILTAHPEDYAAGTFGIAVHASYLALAVALASLAVALLPVRGWSIAVPALLVPPTLLCLALAVDPMGVGGDRPWLVVPITSLALAPAAAAVTMRRRFGGFSRATTLLALAVLVAFSALTATPDSVGGLVNRVFDGLVGVWIVVAALSLRFPRSN